MAKTDRLSEYVENEPIIWKDRKRYLGLPISFTVYKFDHNRFYSKYGLVNTREEETLLYRVLDIKLKSSMWQKVFRVGTVTLFTADQSTPQIEIKNIKHPAKVKAALSKIVEEERDEKRILGKEMFGAAGMLDGTNPIDYV